VWWSGIFKKKISKRRTRPPAKVAIPPRLMSKPAVLNWKRCLQRYAIQLWRQCQRVTWLGYIRAVPLQNDHREEVMFLGRTSVVIRRWWGLRRRKLSSWIKSSLQSNNYTEKTILTTLVKNCQSRRGYPMRRPCLITNALWPRLLQLTYALRGKITNYATIHSLDSLDCH